MKYNTKHNNLDLKQSSYIHQPLQQLPVQLKADWFGRTTNRTRHAFVDCNLSRTLRPRRHCRHVTSSTSLTTHASHGKVEHPLSKTRPSLMLVYGDIPLRITDPLIPRADLNSMSVALMIQDLLSRSAFQRLKQQQQQTRKLQRVFIRNIVTTTTCRPRTRWLE